MFSVRHLVSAVLPLVFVGFIGCADEQSGVDQNAALEIDTAAMTGKPPILGTFRAENASSGIAALTLKTDYTFHMEEAVVCVRYPCVGPQVNGKYRYERKNSATVLTLVDETGRGVGQYMYKMTGDSLYLTPLEPKGAAQTLTRSAKSWCGVPNDCSLQGLPVGPCAGSWNCAENVCSYRCGPPTSEQVNDTAPGSTDTVDNAAGSKAQ